jgi:hypothetical protein
MRMNEERYYRVLAAAQEVDPGREDFFEAVAKKAGMYTKGGPNTVKMLWERGYNGMTPLKEAIVADSFAARSIKLALNAGTDVTDAEQRKRIEEEARARIDAIEVQAQELRLAEVVRLNVTDASRAANKLLRVVEQLGDVIEAKASDLIAEMMEKKLTLKQMEAYARLLKSMVQITTSLPSAAQDVVQVERLIGGKPTEIVDVRGVPEIQAGPDLVDRIMYKAETLKRSLERMKN